LKYILAIPESLLSMADTYFKIYALGLLFQFGYNIIAAILRGIGDSRATLYFLLIASGINIVLDGNHILVSKDDDTKAPSLA